MGVKKRAAKMIGGAAANMCPPGVWCMDTPMILFAIILVGFLVFVGVHLYGQKELPRSRDKPTVVVVENRVPVQTAQQTNHGQNPDPRFFPQSPERMYTVPPDLRGLPPVGGAVPINQQTRGYPDTFQQIGVLTAPGGTETSASPTRTVLPLFGRQAVTNRDRWNYYTRTDGINPVQVPIQYKRRNCDDDLGCEEIMDGESISVPVLGQSYVANVYRYATPRYIPY